MSRPVSRRKFLKLFTLGTLGAVANQYALKDYQRKRLVAFVDLDIDPLGSGYNVRQSQIAIGSGRVLGKGYGQGTQSRLGFLPSRHTDFIFSVIAEETGFCGIAFLICLFIALLFTGTKLARAMTTTFCTMTCLGFTFLVIFQTIINIFVSSGLAPTKGIGLPFISYGGSSLIGLALLLGVVINASLEEHAHE